MCAQPRWKQASGSSCAVWYRDTRRGSAGMPGAPIQWRSPTGDTPANALGDPWLPRRRERMYIKLSVARGRCFAPQVPIYMVADFSAQLQRGDVVDAWQYAPRGACFALLAYSLPMMLHWLLVSRPYVLHKAAYQAFAPPPPRGSLTHRTFGAQAPGLVGGPCAPCDCDDSGAGLQAGAAKGAAAGSPSAVALAAQRASQWLGELRKVPLRVWAYWLALSSCAGAPVEISAMGQDGRRTLHRSVAKLLPYICVQDTPDRVACAIVRLAFNSQTRLAWVNNCCRCLMLPNPPHTFSLLLQAW